MNVKSAFLNGIVEEQVYVEHPKGFVDDSLLQHLYRLKKASYGLKKALEYIRNMVQHAQSDAILKLIVYPSLLCSIMESQHPEILTTEDEEAHAPGFITIGPNLL
ncbi:hypothetical protein LIER_32911 [Lithospermum erythrorhizon]|uniref:Reverse transcriptase Ty1/copia-type domain-containing protein n=1 Tax=Lithospermum erythrorhizon TaxID=34254 RepID=A0AAV3RV67_LITER